VKYGLLVFDYVFDEGKWYEQFLVSLFIHNISVVPCTILLLYYGYHINKAIKSSKLKCLCNTIVTIAVLETITILVEYFFQLITDEKIINAWSDGCTGDPPDDCGSCWPLNLWGMFAHSVNEFVTSILILIMIHPRRQTKNLKKERTSEELDDSEDKFSYMNSWGELDFANRRI
jgi:hypothetical protein